MKSNNEPVNFRINSDMLANLKRIANDISGQKNEEFTYVDLIRCLLANNFAITDDEKELNNQSKFALEMCNKISKQAAMNGVIKIPLTFTSSTINGITSTSPYCDDQQGAKSPE